MQPKWLYVTDQKPQAACRLPGCNAVDLRTRHLLRIIPHESMLILIAIGLADLSSKEKGYVPGFFQCRAWCTNASSFEENPVHLLRSQVEVMRTRSQAVQMIAGISEYFSLR